MTQVIMMSSNIPKEQGEIDGVRTSSAHWIDKLDRHKDVKAVSGFRPTKSRLSHIAIRDIIEV